MNFFSLLWKQFLMLDENEITFFLCRRRRVLHVAAGGAGVRESFCGSVRFTDCEQLSFFPHRIALYGSVHPRCTGMHWAVSGLRMLSGSPRRRRFDVIRVSHSDRCKKVEPGS